MTKWQQRRRQTRETVALLVDIVATRNNVCAASILADDRRHHLSRMRQIVYWCAAQSGHSFAGIAHQVGRDQSTVRDSFYLVERERALRTERGAEAEAVLTLFETRNAQGGG